MAANLPFQKLTPKRQILDSSKLKEFADDSFKFDGKFSKRVENTVEKGEIARHEQFLHFSPCFKRLVLQTRKNPDLFEKSITL